MFSLAGVVASAGGWVVVLAVGLRGRAEPGASDDGVDPLILVGIILSGGGAALIPTLGPLMLGQVAIGLVVAGVGVTRIRRKPQR